MDDLQFDQLLGVLTEIRDDQRRFIQLLQEPGPAPEHVHAPADGGSPGAPFWVCKCGWVYDNERTDV